MHCRVVKCGRFYADKSILDGLVDWSLDASSSAFHRHVVESHMRRQDRLAKAYYARAKQLREGSHPVKPFFRPCQPHHIPGPQWFLKQQKAGLRAREAYSNNRMALVGFPDGVMSSTSRPWTVLLTLSVVDGSMKAVKYVHEGPDSDRVGSQVVTVSNALGQVVTQHFHSNRTADLQVGESLSEFPGLTISLGQDHEICCSTCQSP